jgi:hypothetical protein
MKKEIKKLDLNKKTISNLTPREMSQQVGGGKTNANACVLTKRCNPSW